MYNNNKRDRKQNIIMIIVVFSTMTGMIIMDFVSKLRNANSFKRKLEADGKSEFKLQQTKNLQTTDQFEFFFVVKQSTNLDSFQICLSPYLILRMYCHQSNR